MPNDVMLMTKKPPEEWKLDDFTTEEPYEWIYRLKDNKFMMQQTLAAMEKIAKSLGFKEFKAFWRAYLESKTPKTTIIGDYDTMFPGQPVQLRSGKYMCDEFGVAYINEMGAGIEVISHPILPVKRVTNIETYEEKLEIAYCRGKDPWKSITVSREQLASSQKIISLAKQGVAVHSENAKEVIKYLNTLESANYDDLPRQNSVGHMGWLPDGRFLPYVDDITYDGDTVEFNKIYSEFKPTGSEEEWMKIAREVRAGDSVPARIALAAGFAAPLVKMLEAQSFFVHLWGEKGCGKTVGMMLAASIWGNPEIGGYVKSFSGTKTSMELYAAFCCNLPIFFDELQVINDNRKNFDDIIYMLCEGSSKGRGTKDGGLQLQRRWNTCIMTTGETPIIQSNSAGGASVRTVEVNYKDTPLFGTDERAREVAGLLKKNYGHAGKKFIDAISKPNVIDTLKSLHGKYYSELIKEIDAKQVISAAIILTADKLASKAVFNDKNYLTTDDIKEFLITREESDVNGRCYQFLLDWIAQNPRRFDPSDENSGESWGIIEHDVAYINKTVFENVLRNNGFSVKPFLNWARLHRKLEFEDHGQGDERRLTVRKTLPGGRARCVAIYINDTEWADNSPHRVMTKEQEAYILAADEIPEDMPF